MVVRSGISQPQFDANFQSLVADFCLVHPHLTSPVKGEGKDTVSTGPKPRLEWTNQDDKVGGKIYNGFWYMTNSEGF